MVNQSMPTQEQAKRPSAIWSMLKWTLLYLFPVFKILSVNRLLGRINSFSPDPWYRRQQIHNLLAAVVASAPFLGSIAITYFDDATTSRIAGNVLRTKRHVQRLDFKQAYASMEKIYYDRATGEMVKILFIGFVSSFSLGFIVVRYHPLFVETRKLEANLRKLGVIDREDKHPLILATPLGMLVDITGRSPKEIAQSDAIWLPLNIRIKDHTPDPQKNSVVFFKRAFELKDRYIYKI